MAYYNLSPPAATGTYPTSTDSPSTRKIPMSTTNETRPTKEETPHTPMEIPATGKEPPPLKSLYRELQTAYWEKAMQLDARGAAGEDVTARRARLADQYIQKLEAIFETCYEILTKTTQSKIDLEKTYMQLGRKLTGQIHLNGLSSCGGDTLFTPKWIQFEPGDEPVECQIKQLHVRNTAEGEPPAQHDFSKSCSVTQNNITFSTDDCGNLPERCIYMFDNKSTLPETKDICLNGLANGMSIVPLNSLLKSEMEKYAKGERFYSSKNDSINKNIDSFINEATLKTNAKTLPYSQEKKTTAAAEPTHLKNMHAHLFTKQDNLTKNYNNALFQTDDNSDSPDKYHSTKAHEPAKEINETDVSLNNTHQDVACVCNQEQECFIEQCGCELNNAVRLATAQNKFICQLAAREKCLDKLVMEKEMEIERLAEQTRSLSTYLAKANEELSCLRQKLRSVARECADLDAKLRATTRQDNNCGCTRQPSRFWFGGW